MRIHWSPIDYRRQLLFMFCIWLHFDFSDCLLLAKSLIIKCSETLIKWVRVYLSFTEACSLEWVIYQSYWQLFRNFWWYCGTLTWPNDQMAERPNRMAERPNRPIWNCPLFDVKWTILKYYQKTWEILTGIWSLIGFWTCWVQIWHANLCQPIPSLCV